MAMTAAISMTQDSGFHMNPRNLRILLSCTTHKTTKKFKHHGLHILPLNEKDTQARSRKNGLHIHGPSPVQTKTCLCRFDLAAVTFFSSSLLGPKISRRCAPSLEDSPSRVHFSCSNTSSMGMFSCKHRHHQLR